MVQYWLPMANVVSAFVLLGCYAVALVAITALAEGKTRVLAVLGLVVLFLSTALGALNGSLVPYLVSTTGTTVDLYGLGLIAVGAVGAIGLVLLALAAVASGAASRSPRGH